jgi:purine-binding chemotaxis protein CheW
MNEETGKSSKTSDAANEIQLISFRLEKEEFGVEVDNVREILKVGDITPLPRAPGYLLGMMNLRGNIVPILDPGIRMNLPARSADLTEKARILVLQVSDQLSGVLVDEVFEVRRVEAAVVEPPPQVIRGIDKFFLQGVVKSADKNRLILMLNLIEILNIDITRELKTAVDAGTVSESIGRVKEEIREEQLVTFALGDRDFALDIAVVKEILKVEEITAVPNVPPYVKGVRNIRDRILPIIDMRKVVNMKSREHEDKYLVEHLKEGHIHWMDSLKGTLHHGTPFTKTLDPTRCELGRLLEYRKAHDEGFIDIYYKFKPPHDGLHLTAKDLLKQLRTNKEAAVDLYENTITPYLNTLMTLFNEMESVLAQQAARNRRILILDIQGTTIGLLVDRVLEVSRLPKSLIDTAPAIVASYGKEIKGIARLDGGKRLILIVDQDLLIPMEDVEAISKIQDEGEGAEKVEEKVQEIQYVVFSIKGEEFGLDIDNVQEIFKAESITPVPKAPEFIEGVINLRGNIVPVVDTAERFGVTARAAAEETQTTGDGKTAQKILVTTVKNTVVGLRVDSVREVLRIAQNKIEDAPSLVLSTVDTAYLEGIAKLDDGQRIILLLNIKEMMNKKDFDKLKRVKEREEKKVKEKVEVKVEVEAEVEAEVKAEVKVEEEKKAKPKRKKKTKKEK